MEPVLYRFALRAVRDSDTARDLVQETLLAAVAQADQFLGRSTERTWAIGILAHKIADHFRRRAVRETAAPNDDDALYATPSDEDIERVVAARQELAAVERALAELPERERLAVLLTDVEGLDREECCRVLDVSATHLRVLLHRARNRLRVLLERRGMR